MGAAVHRTKTGMKEELKRMLRVASYGFMHVGWSVLGEGCWVNM